MRFHSLPLSKRYAETEQERASILHRTNTLATAILESDSNCWIASSCLADGPIDEKSIIRKLGLEISFTWYDVVEEADWNTYARECVWQPGTFDQVVERIADGIEAATIWVAKSDETVFAPYDGGFDIIMPSRDAAGLIKERYAHWLPAHEDGL